MCPCFGVSRLAEIEDLINITPAGLGATFILTRTLSASTRLSVEGDARESFGWHNCQASSSVIF